VRLTAIPLRVSAAGEAWPSIHHSYYARNSAFVEAMRATRAEMSVESITSV